MKIIKNSCYGGYSLSEKAIMRYAELKGIKLYSNKFNNSHTDYYLVPKEEFDKVYTKCKNKKNYKEANNLYFDYHNIERTDPILIKVIEELGDEANEPCADLEIVVIPDNIDYEIEDYDGIETIHETHRTW